MAKLNVLKNKKGFTFIETVIALGLLTMFLLIPINNVKKINTVFHQEMFFKQFETEWNYSLLESRVENRGVIVMFSSDNQAIIFKSKILKVPKDIRLKTNKEIKFGAKGGIKPESIIFEYLETKKKKVYKIQMDWGRLIEK